MATYVILYKYTEQGIKNIKDELQRRHREGAAPWPPSTSFRKREIAANI